MGFGRASGVDDVAGLLDLPRGEVRRFVRMFVIAHRVSIHETVVDPKVSGDDRI